MVEGEEDRSKLQREINNMVDWTDRWQMQFNAGKCFVMHFGSRYPNYNYTMGGYVPGGKVLDELVVEKDVDVLVANNLKLAQ